MHRRMHEHHRKDQLTGLPHIDPRLPTGQRDRPGSHSAGMLLLFPSHVFPSFLHGSWGHCRPLLWASLSPPPPSHPPPPPPSCFSLLCVSPWKQGGGGRRLSEGLKNSHWCFLSFFLPRTEAGQDRYRDVLRVQVY